jgi:hypothetical protein
VADEKIEKKKSPESSDESHLEDSRPFKTLFVKRKGKQMKTC